MTVIPAINGLQKYKIETGNQPGNRRNKFALDGSIAICRAEYEVPMPDTVVPTMPF
jgi:hypothetical protein